MTHRSASFSSEQIYYNMYLLYLRNSKVTLAVQVNQRCSSLTVQKTQIRKARLKMTEMQWKSTQVRIYEGNESQRSFHSQRPMSEKAWDWAMAVLIPTIYYVAHHIVSNRPTTWAVSLTSRLFLDGQTIKTSFLAFYSDPVFINALGV